MMLICSRIFYVIEKNLRFETKFLGILCKCLALTEKFAHLQIKENILISQHSFKLFKS